MEKVIGRKEEKKILTDLLQSGKSEFVAIYGRRRVGKTYLIRETLAEHITFHVTALGNATLLQQLANFHVALQRSQPNRTLSQAPNWFMAFQQLTAFLEKSDTSKKVVFIDELPWFDTKGSGFIQALEHFWNSWASARRDIILIACGSAASWMLNKLINNHGGLHNRVTKRLKIVPFTLAECKEFMATKYSFLDYYHIIQLYMVLGGIPFYWEEVNPHLSAMQNIEQLCFRENGILYSEFKHIFNSLFKNADKHLAIVEAIAKKSKGLTRDEIIKHAQIANAGSTSRILEELEQSGFIKKYIPYGKKTQNSLFQLVDFYSLFYLRFLANAQLLENDNWLAHIDSPTYRTWSGYAFEQICLYHTHQIKKALGISGIQTATSSWRGEHAQIDLLIERRDQVINLFEIKFSINSFQISAKYAEELREKIAAFKQETHTRKAVQLIMITTFGLLPNAQSGAWVQHSLSMEDLFG